MVTVIKSRKGLHLTMTLALAAGAAARADYAPVKPGNVWAYQGAVARRFFGGSPMDSARERLTVEIIRENAAAGTFDVRLRDSLFARWSLKSHTPSHSLPDTVIEGTLTYFQDGDRIHLAPANALERPYHGFAALLTNTVFFTAHTAIPGGRSNMITTPASVEATLAAERFEADPQDAWKARFVEGVGFHSGGYRSFPGPVCAGDITRHLELETFNGKAVEVLIAPVAAPLPKETKASCALARPRGRGGMAYGAVPQARRFNAAGRTLAR